MTIQAFQMFQLLIFIFALLISAQLFRKRRFTSAAVLVLCSIFGPALAPVKFKNPGVQQFVSGEVQRFDAIPERVVVEQESFEARMQQKHAALKESSEKLITKTLEQ